VKPEPRWKPPFPVGYAAAIDSMGAVAAPLLASVSAALVTLVIANEEAFRWPSLTLLLLVSATLALITTVQCAFRARQFAVTPSEIEEWWPLDDPATLELRRQYQRYHFWNYQTWAVAASRFYNGGLLCLLFALALMTVPQGDIGDSLGRLAVTALAFLGALSEVVWIVVRHLRKEAQRPLPSVGPEWDPSTSLDNADDG
jgi:MFS family permease